MINNAFYSSLMILVLTVSTFLPSNLSALDFSEHFNGAMRIDGESTWIYAEGNFEAGDAKKFERFLDGRGLWRNQRVVLNSGGGSVLEGIMIGQIIRKHEFRTAVAASRPLQLPFSMCRSTWRETCDLPTCAVVELDADNAWGRHMSGNVVEWTLPCWSERHQLLVHVNSAYCEC